MVNMNKVLAIALLFMFLVPSCVQANDAKQDEGELRVWTFEVDDYIEEVFDESETLIAPKPEEVFFDEITLDHEPRFKYKINTTLNVKPVLYPRKDVAGDVLNIKNGNFSLSSTSRKTKNDRLENALNQRTEARYSRKHFEVATGYETKYDNPDASRGSQNVFLAPKINLSKEVSVIFNNRVDSSGTNFEQEIGLNFKPKLLPNSTFGVTGGTTFKNDSNERTQKVRFNTDLLLW